MFVTPLLNVIAGIVVSVGTGMFSLKVNTKEVELPYLFDAVIVAVVAAFAVVFKEVVFPTERKLGKHQEQRCSGFQSVLIKFYPGAITRWTKRVHAMRQRP